MFQKMFDFFDKKRQNFEYFAGKLSEEFPYGQMFDYNGIEFYVKYYSSSDIEINNKLEDDKCKLYVWCEYFDFDDKVFYDKPFHEDFLRNRLIVLNKIEE